MDERPICGAEIALAFDSGVVARTVVCERRGGPCPWRSVQDDSAPRVISPPYTCGERLDRSELGQSD